MSEEFAALAGRLRGLADVAVDPALAAREAEVKVLSERCERLEEHPRPSRDPSPPD